MSPVMPTYHGDRKYARCGVTSGPHGELKFVSLGSDAVRLDNIRWLDYGGTTGAVRPEPQARVAAVKRFDYHNGRLVTGAACSGTLTLTTANGRVVLRRALHNDASVAVDLQPGLYVSTLSGPSGASSGNVLVW